MPMRGSPVKNDVDRSNRSAKSRRPRLDGLEDRYFLSVVGAFSKVQTHLLAGHAARLPVSSTEEEAADGRSSRGEKTGEGVSNPGTESGGGPVAAGLRLGDGSHSVPTNARDVGSPEAPVRLSSRVAIAT